MSNRFFYAWFSFIAVFAVAMLVIQGYAILNVVNDPSIIGRGFGEIVRGFNEVPK